MVLRRDGQLIETAAACSIKEKCIPARLEEGAGCRKCAKIWRQDAKLDLNQLRTMRVLIRICSLRGGGRKRKRCSQARSRHFPNSFTRPKEAHCSHNTTFGSTRPARQEIPNLALFEPGHWIDKSFFRKNGTPDDSPGSPSTKKVKNANQTGNRDRNLTFIKIVVFPLRNTACHMILSVLSLLCRCPICERTLPAKKRRVVLKKSGK